MNNKTIGFGIIGVLILLFLVIFAPGSSDTPEKDIIPKDSENVFVPEELEVFHRYEEGVHTLFGTIDLPTPCYTLESDLLVAESFPEQVTMIFETSVDEDLMCAQVITPTDFSLQVSADEEATFNSTFNGKSVPVVLRE